MIPQTGAWDQFEENADAFMYPLTIINCTEKLINPSCTCFNCSDDGCFMHCSTNIYLCKEFTKCWGKDLGLITATQVSVFILFVLGIVSVIIMYLRVCNRAIQTEYSNRATLQSEQSNECSPTVSPISIIENRDRPPSYSEACSAPPLYSCPHNRVSMLEPPPVYPETPKLSERNSPSNTPVVAHHI